MSLANNLPRALSCAPFLCLMVAHFECPDIRSIASDGSQEQVVQAVLTCDLRVERGHEHRALAAHDGTAVDIGQHLDIGADPLDDRCTYENGVDGTAVDAPDVEVGLEAVNLTAEGVAA